MTTTAAQVVAAVQQGQLPDLTTYRYGSADRIGAYAVAQKVKHRQAVINACFADPADMAAIRIGAGLMLCSTRTPCNSPFCPMCRHAQQQRFAQEVGSAFANVPNADLRFLTILLSVHYDPADLTLDLINRVKKQLQNFKRSRHLLYGKHVRWLGAFEVDAKQASEVKTTNQVRALIPLGYDQSDQRPFYLLHFHAVVDLAGLESDQVRSVLTHFYPHAYQVKLQSLRSDKDKATNLRDLSTYMLKFRIQQSDNLHCDDNDDQPATYKRTVYTDLYQPSLIRSSAKIVYGLNKFQGMAFKSS